MQITVADDLAAAACLGKLTPEQARRALAVGLYAEERVSLAAAADLAGLDRLSFQRHLAARQIPVHYGEEELAADLDAVRWVAGRRA